MGSLLEQNCHARMYSCTLPVLKFFVGPVINHPTLYCQNMFYCLIKWYTGAVWYSLEHLSLFLLKMKFCGFLMRAHS